MRDSIQIRPAQPDDAEVAALLLSSAYTHTQLDYPLPEEHADGWIERLQNYFRQEGNRFSYQNIQVAELDGKIVGLVLSFGGRDEARLNAAVGPWLEQESEEDEWYVDGLAVFKDWSRRGIGTRLLHVAEQLARQHHYSKVSLNAEQENEPALNLYTQQHYVGTRKTVLYQRHYIRMIKILGE
ncbi:N-acetyltransferase [Dictyobacter sp. S3.2.2.5]|uniref:N-acetyltransferase n=1 Tax=Dictyobacter halimunensis TaxID=3026934 RepID=A0ABQ6FX32_9CHLR|nr:N-acetyltransferase [Dictyobacter sp. S3.2.2.5]